MYRRSEARCVGFNPPPHPAEIEEVQAEHFPEADSSPDPASARSWSTISRCVLELKTALPRVGEPTSARRREEHAIAARANIARSRRATERVGCAERCAQPRGPSAAVYASRPGRQPQRGRAVPPRDTPGAHAPPQDRPLLMAIDELEEDLSRRHSVLRSRRRRGCIHSAGGLA